MISVVAVKVRVPLIHLFSVFRPDVFHAFFCPVLPRFSHTPVLIFLWERDIGREGRAFLDFVVTLSEEVTETNVFVSDSIPRH